MPLKLIEKEKGEKAPESLGKARDSFIESAGKISANMLGLVSKVGGQIYALLFLSRNPLSLDEITDVLGLSKGNVSVHVRMLEGFGLVRKVWVKGSRKDYYGAARDYPRKFLKEFFDRVRAGIDDSLRVINRCKGEFQEASKSCRGEDLEDARFMASQLLLRAHIPDLKKEQDRGAIGFGFRLRLQPFPRPIRNQWPRSRTLRSAECSHRKAQH